MVLESWLDACDAVEKRSPLAANIMRRLVINAPAVIGYVFVCFIVFVVDCLRLAVLFARRAPPRAFDGAASRRRCS